MPAPNASESDAENPLISRRASAAEASARQVLAAPPATPTKTVRVSDDKNFLGWLERVSEAKPIDHSAASAAPKNVEPTEAELLAAMVSGDPMDEIGVTPESEPEAASAPDDDPLANIPAAIVVKKRGRKSSSSSRPPASGEKRTIAGDVPRAKVPEKRNSAAKAKRAGEVPEALDSGRILGFEDYNKGKTRVEPLKRGGSLAQPGEKKLERPKFMDGKLPRSVERGVLHPTPWRIGITSVLLLLTKLLTIAVIIALPVAAILDGKQLIPKVMPLVLAFLGVGLAYILSSNRTRCRVCSCHFFYVRRCHKHKSAHRLPLVGPACTAALHLLMFRWMRCMYCGTAIRLRGSTGVGKPKRGKDAYAEEE